MTEHVDFEAIWERAKHGGLSDQDVATCEQVLREGSREDLHLPLLVVGVARKPSDSLIKLVEQYLHEGQIEAERYCALRVLCRYWDLWKQYLPVLLGRLNPESWDREYGLAEEAVSLLGEYLFKFNDEAVWKNLLAAYDEAMDKGDSTVADSIRDALLVGFRGTKGALETDLSGVELTDEDVLIPARRRANMLS